MAKVHLIDADLPPIYRTKVKFVKSVKFGRRRVYDKVDLDAWLEEYKQRG